MDPRTRTDRWALAAVVLALGLLAVGSTAPEPVQAGFRRIEPAEVLPMDQIDPRLRDSVAEVIRDNSFHQQGQPETFPCNPRIYLALLNEPALTLALWKDLSPNPARLQMIAPGRYQGTDGAGTVATWEYALRSPRVHVLLCDLEYTTPRGNARLEGRIVLIARSNFLREPNGETWVKQDLEAFVKIDSRGWRAVATTVKPIIEKVLEDQVQEAGWFVSLMSRLVEMYPNWATTVSQQETQVPADVREGFQTLVAETRRPGAHTGRPTMAQNDTESIRR